MDRRSLFRGALGATVIPFVRHEPATPGVPLLWSTKDGRLLAIQEMETVHLYNSIRKIERTPGWRQEFLEPMKAEFQKRSRPDGKID